MANYKVPIKASGEVDEIQVVKDMLKYAIREFRKNRKEMKKLYPQRFYKSK